jgi:nucleoside-diphosphate-sugar epimerase
MRIFVTGATGFIGTAVVRDLIGAGYQVLGLARSDEGAAALTGAGAQVHRGHLEDLDSLRGGAALADGVIHAGFIHDFARFKENCEIDRRAIEAIGDVLAGSNRPLIVTGGLPVPTEDQLPPPGPGPTPRVSEQTADAVAARGVHAMVMRLPQVHDRDRHGLVSYLIELARQKGVSAYAGTGNNRWPAVHRLDAAPLYRLILEKGVTGGRYHAVAEEGVALRGIAEAIGRGLKIPVVSLSPEEAGAHFGWLGHFVGMDMPASSTLTQQRLGWRPTQTAGMIADLDEASAFTQ